MSYLLIFFVLSIITYMLLSFHKNSRIREMARKLPGLPARPLIGNAYNIVMHAKGTLYYFMECHKKYGNLVRHWVGTTLYVFLTNPEDVEILLRDTENITKSSTYDFLVPWLGQGLVTSTGKHWHVHRKIITPAFHFNILEKFVDVFNEKGKILIELLNNKVDQGQFNIFPFINLYALDAIMETSMGTTFDAQQNEDSDYVHAIHRIAQIVMKRTFNPFLRSKFIFPLTAIGREHDRVINKINGHCFKTIQEKRDEIDKSGELDLNKLNETDEFGEKRRLAFLDLLLYGQRSGSGFTDKDIVEEVNTFMFAGHDTTSSAMAFAIYYLSKYKEVQDKIYNEICEIFGPDNSDLTLKDLNSTTYLDQVVKEVLRIAPAIPSYSRLLEKDLKLTKHEIPAGTSITVFTYALHRNEKYFPDPETFDPERFSTENAKHRHPYAYVPFSAGPRNCIGQKYAQLEIKSTLIKLVRNFEILEGLMAPNVQSTVVLTSTNGINVRLTRRRKC